MIRGFVASDVLAIAVASLVLTLAQLQERKWRVETGNAEFHAEAPRIRTLAFFPTTLYKARERLSDTQAILAIDPDTSLLSRLSDLNQCVRPP